MTYLRLRLSYFESKNLIWETLVSFPEKPALWPVTDPFWREGTDTDTGCVGLILFISCCVMLSCIVQLHNITSKLCWFEGKILRRPRNNMCGLLIINLLTHELKLTKCDDRNLFRFKDFVVTDLVIWDWKDDFSHAFELLSPCTLFLLFHLLPPPLCDPCSCGILFAMMSKKKRQDGKKKSDKMDTLGTNIMQAQAA